jgi:hypothetical protein
VKPSIRQAVIDPDTVRARDARLARALLRDTAGTPTRDLLMVITGTVLLLAVIVVPAEVYMETGRRDGVVFPHGHRPTGWRCESHLDADLCWPPMSLPDFSTAG